MDNLIKTYEKNKVHLNELKTLKEKIQQVIDSFNYKLEIVRNNLALAHEINKNCQKYLA